MPVVALESAEDVLWTHIRHKLVVNANPCRPWSLGQFTVRV